MPLISDTQKLCALSGSNPLHRVVHWHGAGCMQWVRKTKQALAQGYLRSLSWCQQLAPTAMAPAADNLTPTFFRAGLQLVVGAQSMLGLTQVQSANPSRPRCQVAGPPIASRQ